MPQIAIFKYNTLGVMLGSFLTRSLALRLQISFFCQLHNAGTSPHESILAPNQIEINLYEIVGMPMGHASKGFINRFAP